MTSLISQTTTPSAPAALNEKVCTQCKVLRPYSEYHNNRAKKDGKQSNCKPCQRARQNKHKKDYPDIYRNKQYKRLYGIDLADYENMLKEQGGVCASCGESSSKRLVVDHCHESGKVRSLLCGSCNTALGLLQENTHRILALANYVQVHKDRVP